MSAWCDCRVPMPWRESRACLNLAKWIVWFTTPDDGKTMRARTCVHRCYWHRDEKYLPKGATQIVTEALLSATPDSATEARGEHAPSHPTPGPS